MAGVGGVFGKKGNFNVYHNFDPPCRIKSWWWLANDNVMAIKYSTLCTPNQTYGNTWDQGSQKGPQIGRHTWQPWSGNWNEWQWQWQTDWLALASCLSPWTWSLTDRDRQSLNCIQLICTHCLEKEHRYTDSHTNDLNQFEFEVKQETPEVRSCFRALPLTHVLFWHFLFLSLLSRSMFCFSSLFSFLRNFQLTWAADAIDRVNKSRK